MEVVEIKPEMLFAQRQKNVFLILLMARNLGQSMRLMNERLLKYGILC